MCSFFRFSLLYQTDLKTQSLYFMLRKKLYELLVHVYRIWCQIFLETANSLLIFISCCFFLCRREIYWGWTTDDRCRGKYLDVCRNLFLTNCFFFTMNRWLMNFMIVLYMYLWIVYIHTIVYDYLNLFNVFWVNLLICMLISHWLNA